MPEKSQTIRVFVSSTFRDMQAERDELVLRIFPQLRRLCEQRGVTWGEVDLRWGVTDEQVAEGQVLPICLEEIRRCRPYFIGLLGERYGWVPDAIPEEVAQREPWIAEQAAGGASKSVTELEILHGVLNNPAMADHAFFYFRDPNFADAVEQGRADFQSEDAASADKLRALKDRIRREHQAGNLKYEPREDYADAKALGERVLDDFTALIDTLYPEGEQPSPLERERRDHEAFARSRAGVYIGRQEYFDRLDAHVAGDGSPLVVLGESGGGKSALLANWFLDRFEASTADTPPAPFALLHFIGGSPDSANATGLLRRIMLELKERFELPDEVPAQPEKIREAFPDWLTQTAGRGQIVLVLDALNQLEDVDNAADLGWLPRVFPKHCRVILSTLPGRSLDAVTERGWLERTPPLDVRPLDEAERRRLIHDFLQQHTRDLGAERTQRLVDAPQTANPLYLRVLLDELRVFGIHERLNERIEWYLEANDPYELYRKVIERWEDAYADGSTLVGDTLSLLWAARRGLSEAELLEALGQPGRPLPRADWSPLFLAMSDALVSRSGLLTFAYDFLRTATRDAYLPDESQQQAAHRQLAKYFEDCNDGTRRTEELPWQLCQAQMWPRVYDLLSDLDFFTTLWRIDKFDVMRYWSRLETCSAFRIVEGYANVLADSIRYESVALKVARLLQDTDHPTEASQILKLCIDYYRATNDRAMLQLCLGNLGTIFYELGDLSGAMRVYEQQALYAQEIDDHESVARSLHNRAMIDLDQGQLERGQELLRKEEEICRQLNDKDGLQDCLAEQAYSLFLMERFDAALKLREQQMLLCREIGNALALQSCVGEQGVLHHAMGDRAAAMQHYCEQEKMCRELGAKRGLASAMGNQAVIHADSGDREQALRLQRQVADVGRELGDNALLATALTFQAKILATYPEQLATALGMADEALTLANRHHLTTLAHQIQPVVQELERALRKGMLDDRL